MELFGSPRFCMQRGHVPVNVKTRFLWIRNGPQHYRFLLIFYHQKTYNNVSVCIDNTLKVSIYQNILLWRTRNGKKMQSMTRSWWVPCHRGTMRRRPNVLSCCPSLAKMQIYCFGPVCWAFKIKYKYVMNVDFSSKYNENLYFRFFNAFIDQIKSNS